MRHRQQGIFLLEAIIGILIFLVGILALLALQANTIAAQSDAQYRIEAANLTNQLLSRITLSVDRSNVTGTPSSISTSLLPYAHRATGALDSCNFSGTDSANPDVAAWVTASTTTAATRLPGATPAMQQVLVDTGANNRVTITLCWQTSNDARPRRHTVVSYIN